MGNKPSTDEHVSVKSEPSEVENSSKSEESKILQSENSKNSREINKSSKTLTIENDFQEISKNSNESIEKGIQSYNQIYKFVIDTAQNYKIEKFLIDEPEVQNLESSLPEKMKFLGLYGDSTLIKTFIEDCFEEPLTSFPSLEGVYLFLNENNESQGILAYITEDNSLYTSKPMKLGNRSISIIRILSDICLRIVACIPDEILENWQYSEDGKHNPFIPKILRGAIAKMETRVITESSLKRMKNKNYAKNKSIFHLPMDNSKFLFSFEFSNSREEISGKLEVECENLLRGLKTLEENSKDAILGFIDQFFIDLGFIAVDKSRARKDLNSVLVGYVQNVDKKITQVLKEIFDDFKEEKFVFKESFKIFKSRYRVLLCKDSDFFEDLNKISNDFSSQGLIQSIIEDKFNRFFKPKDPKSIKTFVKNTLDILVEKCNSFKMPDHNQITEELIKIAGKQKNKSEILSNFAKYLPKSLNLKFPEILLKKVENSLKSFENFIKTADKSVTEKIITRIEEDLPVNQVLFSLMRSRIEFEIHGTKIESSTKSLKKLFQCIISVRAPIVKQVVFFSNQFCYAFIKNIEESKTHVIRFNPFLKSKENYEILEEIEDSNVFVAWGSNVNKFVIFLNTKKTAYHGSLFQNKFIQLDIELKIYGKKINFVLSSHYIHKTRKLYILNENGILYKKELSNDFIGIEQVTTFNAQTGEKFTFSSRCGEQFRDFDITPDEQVFVMQTENFIECFNKDLNFLYDVKLKSSFESFKTLHIDNQYILLIKSRKLKLFQLNTPQRISVISTNKIIKEIIEGNPILDLHQLGIIKFGPILQETLITKGRRSLGYYLEAEDDLRVSSYLSHLSKVSDSFDILNYVNPSKAFKHLKKTKKSSFSLTVLTRLPLHLAVIELGNLKPLQNGENNFDKLIKNIKKQSFLESLTKYIKFTCFEKVLEKIDDLLVFSIIGRQSSGKSYLLNRIVGTRFDVAAERCTEGIWMGIGKINEKFVVVFDCEGMFTVERSTQEEIKLCLFLSSLSDLVILNSDLSSGKQIITLFNQFASGVDRIRGDKLFGGILDITFRDIPDGQGEGASTEFEKFLNTLVSAQQQETLMKLFNQNFYNSQYHNFENEIFEQEISKSREKYSKISQKWGNGQTLCQYIKIVLAQIYSDLKTSSNEELLKLKIDKVKKILEKSLSDIVKAEKILGKKCVNVNFEFGRKTCSFDIPISSYKKNPEDPLSHFKTFFQTEETKRFEMFLHNEWFFQMQENVKKFTENRKSLYLENLKKDLIEIGVESRTMEQECLIFEHLLEIPSFCLKKCKICYFMCTLPSDHLTECSCCTNHCCKDSCDFCESFSYCSKEAGHIGKHLCETVSHT